MTHIHILHLSDLHFDPDHEKDSQLVIDALFEDCQLLVEKQLHPDAIIFSGDLIFAGDHGYTLDRSDYKSVYSVFVEPLLDLLDLNEDQFFLCAGNHDVQRNAVDPYVEAGLKAKLIDRASVNTLIDERDSYPAAFKRMENFEKFRSSLSSNHLIRSDVLSSTYEFTQSGQSVGIACVNTAWRAFGGEDDYGQLVIGERTIDRCIEEIKHCALRIGVGHHPFEYLHEFERDPIKRRIFGAFNLWLFGHSHTPDVCEIRQFNNNRIVTIGGGALYQSRNYFNGYALIDYCFSDREGNVHLREYIDRDRSFHPALAYEEDSGIVQFTLAESSAIPLEIDVSLIETLRPLAEHEASSILLPSIVGSSKAPKDAKRVFVEPALARKPEYRESLIKEDVFISDICTSDENFLIVGKREAGKTTILNHIRLFHLNPEIVSSAKIPLLIDYMEVPKGKTAIVSAIRNSLRSYGIEVDPLQLLENERCVILVDNLNFTDLRRISALHDFIEKYPDHQYIFTVNQTVLDELRTEEPTLGGLDYQKVYINPFGRKQIRELAEKWYSEEAIWIPAGELADEIQLRLDEINLPFTPYVVSMMFLIIEQWSEYRPHNRASLLGDFIRLLLYQPFGKGIAPGGLDYRNIEDFLSNIARILYERQTTYLQEDEFIQVSIKYFVDRSLPVLGGVPSLVQLLVTRGILRHSGGIIEFRFISFMEYFLAKGMQEDQALYEDVTSEANYLSFSRPIELLTGLERKNMKLIECLRERLRLRLESVKSQLGLEYVTAELFQTLSIEHSIIEEIPEAERETFIETIRRSRFTEDIKDAISDIAYRRPIRIPEAKTMLDEDPIAQLPAIAGAIELYARCIRNCELLDDDNFKRESIRFCIESSLLFLYLSYMTIEGAIQDFDQSEIEQILHKLEKELDKDLGYDIKLTEDQIENMIRLVLWFMKMFPAMMMEALLSDWLGNPKLGMIFESEISDKSLPLVIRLIDVLLYADMRLPHFLDHVEAIKDEIIDHRFFRELTYFRLRYIYSMKELTRAQRQSLENILAGIVVKHQDKHPREKSRIIGRLRSSRSHSSR